MKTEKRIVIPNAECMTKEQYQELKDYLDSCPIGYEEQDITFNQEDSI
jgi:hypothetical protein